jgi:hypothetical protein
LANRPVGLTQNKFSSGFKAGFDMPINKARTVAIAAGVGLTYDNYNENMAITGTAENAVYNIINSKNYSKINSLLALDVPSICGGALQRIKVTSFGRIYTGIKFSYLPYDKSVLIVIIAMWKLRK